MLLEQILVLSLKLIKNTSHIEGRSIGKKKVCEFYQKCRELNTKIKGEQRIVFAYTK